MSTYRLVELSAQSKKNVPHRTLLTAAFVALGVAKLPYVTPATYIMRPDRPGEFGRAIGISQELCFVRQRAAMPDLRTTPPSAA